MPGCHGAGTAERSYPASKVRCGDESSCPASKVRGGGQEELSHASKLEARAATGRSCFGTTTETGRFLV